MQRGDFIDVHRIGNSVVEARDGHTAHVDSHENNTGQKVNEGRVSAVTDAFICHPLTMVVHLQHASSTDGTVVGPFGLSSPTLFAPLIGGIEVIRHGCHKGFGEAGFFVVVEGIL